MKLGGNVNHKFGRTAIAVAAVTLGTVGFAGTALAGGVHGSGGSGGSGGAAKSNCAIPIGVTAGVIGQGGDVSQCNATGGGGGNGGGGVGY
jgi:hypothetical protein